MTLPGWKNKLYFGDNLDILREHVASESVDLMRVVPGIGKKTAERLILELKDKIGAGLIATRAVATLPPSSDLSLEDKIKLALQYFGGKIR